LNNLLFGFNSLSFQEEEMKELRNEVSRLKSDFEQKWSSQIRMVKKKNEMNNFVKDK
jgi:hypothetical protein